MTSSTSKSIAVEIADHLPVFSLMYNLKCSPIPDTIKVRDFKKIDEISFLKYVKKRELAALI